MTQPSEHRPVDASDPLLRFKVKACSIEGCDRVARSRGLCVNHHDQWKRRTDPAYRERRNARNREQYATRSPEAKARLRARARERERAKAPLYGARYRVVDGRLVDTQAAPEAQP